MKFTTVKSLFRLISTVLLCFALLCSCDKHAATDTADTLDTSAESESRTESESKTETEKENESMPEESTMPKEETTETSAVSHSPESDESTADSEEVSYPTEGDVSISSSELTKLLSSGKASGGCKYNLTDKLVISGTKSQKLDGKGAVISSPAGIELSGNEKLTVTNLTLIGEVTLTSSKTVVFDSVTFSSDGNTVTVDGESTEISLKNCKISGENGVVSSSPQLKLLSCEVTAEKTALSDSAADGMIAVGCTLSGKERGIISSGDGAYIRNNSITAQGVAIELSSGTLNCLVAENTLTAEKSVSANAVRNTSIVLNRIGSADIISSHGVYFVSNTVSGSLILKDNRYLLCDENLTEGGTVFKATGEGNKNSGGDTITDVDKRLAAGADEALLPQVDKDAFVGMDRRSTVYDPASDSMKDITAYILAASKKSDKVIVPPGAYSAKTTLQMDRTHSDTEIYAYGVYYEKKTVGNMAHLERVENLTLRGMTFGYPTPSVNQMYVLKKEKNGVTVIVGAGMGNLKVTHKSYNLFREGEAVWETDEFTYDKLKKNSDGTAFITLSGKALSQAKKGDIMTVGLTESAYNFVIRATDKVTLRDVTTYTASTGFCFKEELNESAVTYYRVANTTRSGEIIDKETYDKYKALEEEYGVSLEIGIDELGRYRGPAYKLCSADGIHAYACREGSVVISSIFENQSDDGTNQRHDHSRLASIVDNGDGTATVTYKGNMSEWNVWANQLYFRYCERFKKGDRIMIYTSTGRLVADTAVLSNDKSAGRFTDEKTKAKGLMFSVTIPSDGIDFDALKGFNLDDNNATGKKVLVDNLSWACIGFKFDNVLVQNTRARGLLFKSSDGVIKNCTVKDTGLAGIALKYELNWGESGSTADTSIVNCLFDNNGMFKRDRFIDSPLIVSGLSGTKNEGKMIYRNLTITDNVFTNRNLDYAVYISAAMDVKLNGNDFGLTAAGKVPKWAVYLQNSVNIELTGNNFRGSDPGTAVKKLKTENLFGGDIAN